MTFENGALTYPNDFVENNHRLDALVTPVANRQPSVRDIQYSDELFIGSSSVVAVDRTGIACPGFLFDVPRRNGIE